MVAIKTAGYAAAALAALSLLPASANAQHPRSKDASVTSTVQQTYNKPSFSERFPHVKLYASGEETRGMADSSAKVYDSLRTSLRNSAPEYLSREKLLSALADESPYSSSRHNYTYFEQGAESSDPAPKPRSCGDAKFVLAYLGFNAATVSDTESIVAALGNCKKQGARCKEINPVMRPLVNNGRKVAYPVNILINGWITYEACRQYKAGKSIWLIPAVAGIGFHGTGTVFNLKAALKERKD